MTPPLGSILLTGANGGIAVGFIQQLLKSEKAKEYKGIYTVRDPAKADALEATLKAYATSDHDHEIFALDLSTVQTTREAANKINSRVSGGSLPPIRALILNAGTQDCHGQEFTADGIERTFAVNYLHNVLLVLLLLQSMDKTHGRIIIIGSTQIFTDWNLNARQYTDESQKIFFTSVDKLAKGEAPIEDNMKAGCRRYAMSKVMMLMFMYNLQRRLDSDPTLSKVSILALDPGWVSTPITRNSPLGIRIFTSTFRYLAPPLSLIWPNHFIRTAARSGDDLVRVCFDTDKFGEYPKTLYIDGSELGDTIDEAKDEKKQQALWEGSLKYAQIKDGDTVLANWR